MSSKGAPCRSRGCSVQQTTVEERVSGSLRGHEKKSEVGTGGVEAPS